MAGTATYPEGGWGWVVVGSCFIVHFIVFGTLKSLGVLISPMKDDFGKDVWIFGSIVALHYGMQFVLSPVAAFLARKLSCRVVATLGGILYGTGLVLSALTHDVTILAIGLVVISGTGAAFTVPVMTAELAFYFQKKFPEAVLVVLFAAPLGMMVYGPVTQVLLDTYGWRGAMLLLGAVSFHIVAAAMLTRKQTGIHTYMHIPERISPVQDEDGGGSDELKPQKRNQVCRSWISFSSALGLNVFSSVEFMTLACVRMLLNIAYGGVVVYMVANGLSVGLSTTESSFLTTAWGIGNLVGLCVTGFILHKKLVSSYLMATLGLATIAPCLAFAPFVPTFLGQMVNTFVIGAGVDCVIEVVWVMTRDLPFSDDNFVVVLGWQTFLAGVASSIGDTLSGWLHGLTGTFHATFFLYSAAMFAVIIPLLMNGLQALKLSPKYRERMVVLPSLFKRATGSYSASCETDLVQPQ